MNRQKLNQDEEHSKNSNLKGKRVLVFQQRNWGLHIGHYLAKQLQEEGCSIAALTFSPGTRRFLSEQKEITYELIEDHDKVMADPWGYLSEDRYPLADICQELGVDSIWPLVQSLRNHVKSYADKYYYGFNQNISDENIIGYVQATHKSFKKLFDDFKPDIIIAPTFVTYPHIVCNLYAKKRNIPMLTVTDAKIPGITVFSYDYLDRKSPFIDHLKGLENNKETDAIIVRAREYIKEFRTQFKNPTTIKAPKTKTLIARIRHTISPLYHIARWYLYAPKINAEGTGIIADWRPPHIILRDHYAHDQYERAANAFPYYPLEKIGKCVYFPLQFQPEASIDLTAPRFNNQIETARQVAMSLPDDYTLAVKDHPAMFGYRSPSYLKKLAKTPNIKLIDYRIPSETILKKADMVVSPSGTTLAEAAFLSKPAIQLGDLGITQMLPNVTQHGDFTTLEHTIRHALSENLKTAEYEKRLENFVATAFAVGFDLPYADIWNGRRDDLLPSLWKIYRNEISNVLIS